MDKKLKKIFENLTRDAKPYTGPKIRVKKKSSLSQIIKTKEQADRFMKALKSAK